jgi:hypothetical protein
MTTYYEIWDDETGNRVGGSFAPEAEARALLTDVLRVNGADAVRAGEGARGILVPEATHPPGLDGGDRACIRSSRPCLTTR